MPSFQEIVNEVTSIKQSSEKLAADAGAANVGLAEQSSRISQLVQGSRTGQEAVFALSAAARSLADAVSSMRSLGRTCDSCVAGIMK